MLAALQASQDCLQTFSLYRDLDALPFVLCRALVEGKADNLPFPVAYLTNGDSSVRLYLCELAWLVRACLHHDRCVDPLLRNVENTLGHWLASLALCRHLFADEAEFWAAAESYEPEERPGQYKDRIAWARESDSDLEYPQCFLELERRCAHVVHDFVFGLRVRAPSGPRDATARGVTHGDSHHPRIP